MSHMASAKVTQEETEEFKEYLEIHKMSEGKSLWEVVSEAMAHTFLGIEESEIKPQPNSPLPHQ